MSDCNFECHNLSFYREEYMDCFNYEFNGFLLFVDISIDYKYIDKFISDINMYYEKAKTEDDAIIAFIEDDESTFEPKFTLIRYKDVDDLAIYNYAKSFSNTNLTIILDKDYISNDTIKLVHDIHEVGTPLPPPEIILKKIFHQHASSLRGKEDYILSYRCRVDCFVSYNATYVFANEILYTYIQKLENNTIVDFEEN